AGGAATVRRTQSHTRDDGGREVTLGRACGMSGHVWSTRRRMMWRVACEGGRDCRASSELPRSGRVLSNRMGGKMFRRVFARLVTAGLLLIATPAFAQPPVTETVTEKNVVETFVDVVPTCEGGGPLYTVTTTVNRI